MYTLWHGDCLEEMSRIEAGSVDAIICDLPFGVTANKWDVIIPFEPLWREYKRVIKSRGAVVLFGSQPFTSMLVMSNPKWFKWEDVWDKKMPVGFLNAKIMPLRRHENILVFGKGRITYNPTMRKGKYRAKNLGGKKSDCYGQYTSVPNWSDDYYPTSIIEIHNANQKAKEHSNQKPVALLSYLIRTYSNEGDLILDNTFGSCSTGEAALRTGRRFIGIERDANYFEIGVARMERVAAELRGELGHLPMFSEVMP